MCPRIFPRHDGEAARLTFPHTERVINGPILAGPDTTDAVARANASPQTPSTKERDWNGMTMSDSYRVGQSSPQLTIGRVPILTREGACARSAGVVSCVARPRSVQPECFHRPCWRKHGAATPAPRSFP